MKKTYIVYPRDTSVTARVGQLSTKSFTAGVVAGASCVIQSQFKKFFLGTVNNKA
jgi:hypothetical protein